MKTLPLALVLMGLIAPPAKANCDCYIIAAGTPNAQHLRLCEGGYFISHSEAVTHAGDDADMVEAMQAEIQEMRDHGHGDQVVSAKC